MTDYVPSPTFSEKIAAKTTERLEEKKLPLLAGRGGGGVAPNFLENLGVKDMEALRGAAF